MHIRHNSGAWWSVGPQDEQVVKNDFQKWSMIE